MPAASESPGSAKAAATGRTMSAGTKAPESALIATRLLASEEVQTVDEVQHAIAVDGIGLRVPTHEGGNVTAHVALVAEDIKDLEGDGCGISL